MDAGAGVFAAAVFAVDLAGFLVDLVAGLAADFAVDLAAGLAALSESFSSLTPEFLAML